ncbi:hypothetical protein SRHO_G00090170 [Serrasalmus rhombeus]
MLRWTDMPPRLQSLFRMKASRTGKVSKVLSQLFRMYDLQEQVDVHVRRAALLLSLPAYLYEDDSSFVKTWNSDEPDINDISLVSSQSVPVQQMPHSSAQRRLQLCLRLPKRVGQHFCLHPENLDGSGGWEVESKSVDS